MSRGSRRLPVIAAVALVLAALVTGCAPDPAPTPTPTGFASEEEAFAAAEATYRAYVDAVNQVDFRDPSTFEPALSWTTGEQNEGERQDFSESHAEGLTTTGRLRIASLEPVEWDDRVGSVQLAICLDISGTDILDADGNSIVSPDRVPVLPLLLTLVEADASPTGLLIAHTAGREGAPSCS